ncbi:unnamed protein product, partial [Porites evermanni]
LCFVQLVADGYAEFDFILSRLLNILPSARKLCGVVKALSQLLTLQVYQCWKSGTGYKCPFSLRSPPHPFITVLISRPDYATHLIQQVNLILLNSINSSCVEPTAVMQMLESFFKFVLQDPKTSVTELVRQQLFTGLLQTASTLLRFSGKNGKILAENILHFLMSTLPLCQIDDKHLSQTTFLVHTLVNWLLEHRDIFNDIHHVKAMVNNLLSVCCEGQLHGYDMGVSLHLLQRIQHHYPQAFAQICVIPALSCLLLTSPQDYQLQILQVCCSISQNASCLAGSPPSPEVCSHLLLLLPILLISTTRPPLKHTSFSVSGKQEDNSNSIVSLARQILQNLEVHVLAISRQLKYEKDRLAVPTPAKFPCSFLSQYMSQMSACSHQLILLLRNEEIRIKCWLESLQRSFSTQKQVLRHVPLMLSALLVTSAGEIVVDTLNTITALAKADPSQGLYFLPVLLYKLCKESNPEVKGHLLYSIPKLATHKFCIGPVLHTIQSIGSQSGCQLKPLSLRLMCKLWQSQNRVFPQLQRVLNANDTQRVGMELNLEIQIAKAACLLDICKERPSQHGADLLSLLSKLLNQNTKPGETVNHPSALVVSLALQALEQLCKAEVVDLCTAWKVLSGKLSQDRRPAVLCSLCQLFSSVPSLATNSQDYQELKNHILSFLWSLTEHEQSLVSCAAFDALSLFDPSGFKLIHLPKEIYHPLRAKLMASKTLVRGAGDENEDMVAVEKSIDNSIPPGAAYVALLQTINQQGLSGFQKLLSSVIRREAGSLPRGFSQSISRTTLSHDRNLQSIPGFLMSHYEKSKTPGLTQGLAAGVLFSFEPPFEEHQGKRLRRYLVSCARKYRQMLESLLHEVPVHPSEWHRTLLIPQAWSLFMVRAYEACLEGRKAELDMQYSHGHIQDVEELKTRQMNSWLWVRDQMTEQLKAASRGNPSVQGNSVFALAGLAHAVSLYAQKQNNSGRNTDWLTMVTDTIMVVLDGNYKPKGRTLTWCQQVSSPTSTASSLLARSCAALSLSLLVPSLVTLDTDRIHSMAELLKQWIPGQAKAGSSSVVQMTCSLGLGLFLSRLYEEHFSDLCGKEGYLLMTTALDALENAALEQKAENTEGACLGLGLALSFICKESVVDSRVHMTNMYNKLITMLDDEHIEDQRLQSLCFSVALVCVNAFHTGLLSVDEAKNCADKIQKIADRHCQQAAYGVSLSYGMLLHGLVSCGHGGVVQLAKDQGEVWRSILEREDTSELQRLAALNGVMGLLGSDQSLFIFDSSDAVGIFPSSERNIIKFLQQIISRPEDVGLCSNLSWLLGQLYAASASGSIVNTKRVPSDYGYLPEDSALRPLFDFLVQAGKKGPYVSFSGKLVPAVLESLISGAEVTLPPVNWAAVLSPILRANFGEETSQLCIQFAVDQARTATSSCGLSSFLSSLLSPEVFMGLGDSCRRTLLKNLSRLVYVVSSSKLRRFYEEVLTVPLKNESGHAVNTVAILEAHLSVLKLQDPPQSVIGWTITALRHIYNACSCTQDISDHACLTLLARCLTLVPVNDVESIVDDTQTITTKALVIRCNAIANGKAPMKWLMPCIESGILTADISGEKCKEFLCYVSSVVIAADHIFKHDDKLLLFLELISLFKIALQDGSKTSAHRVLLNCFTVLSMVSAAWCTVPILQALAPFPSNQPTVGQITACCESLERLPWLLPLTLSTLLREEPWAPVAGKVLDWLVSLLDDPTIPTHLRESALVEGDLIELRYFDGMIK